MPELPLTPESQAPESAPAAHAPAPDPTASINAAIERALAPLTNTVQQVAQTVQGLQDRLPAPKPTAENGDEILRNFMEDPKGFSKAQAVDAFNQAAQGELVPFMHNVAEAQADTILATYERTFDETYGEGQFKELASTKTRDILSRMPLASRVKPDVVNAAIETSLVGKIPTLMDLRAKQMTREKPTPSEPLGGGIRSPRGEGLSAEEKAVLGEFVRGSGIEISEKEMLTARNRGNTIDDWRPAKQG